MINSKLIPVCAISTGGNVSWTLTNSKFPLLLLRLTQLLFQYEAKKKECDTMQCDREVALLALKQSIEMSGEPLQRELNSLKVVLAN